jgi:hypothetical protein
MAMALRDGTLERCPRSRGGSEVSDFDKMADASTNLTGPHFWLHSLRARPDRCIDDEWGIDLFAW